MRTTHRTLLPLAAALALAGCGGTTEGDAPAAGPDTIAAVIPAGRPCRFFSGVTTSALATDKVTGRRNGESDCLYAMRLW